jgi:transcriptional regulator with XRE-family HTH domain
VKNETPTLGERVRARRLELGISQEELAVRSQLRAKSILRIEAGADPRSSNLRRIAAVLGVSSDWLLFGSDSPKSRIRREAAA